MCPEDTIRRELVTSRVYFIQQGNDGPIKVGFASDLESRLRALQGANPVELHVLASIAGTMAEEQKLHALFAVGRLRGEWFQADTPGLQEFIKAARATPLWDPDDLCCKCGARPIAIGNRKYCDPCSPKRRPQFTAEDDRRLEAALLEMAANG